MVALVRWAIYDLQSQIYFIVLFFCKMKLIKSQITNLKLQKNLNNQCIKSQTCLDNWGLKLGYCLLLVNCVTPTKIKFQIRCSFLLPINEFQDIQEKPGNLPDFFQMEEFQLCINSAHIAVDGC